MGTDVTFEVSHPLELRASLRPRRHKAHDDPSVNLRHVDRHEEIGVVRHHDCTRHYAFEGISQQMGGEIDVRPFLLGLVNPFHLDGAVRFSFHDEFPVLPDGLSVRIALQDWCPHGRRQERPVMNSNSRQSRERTQIGRLPHCHIWVVRSGFHASSEIVDALNGVVRQNPVKERFKVQPLMRRALETSVVEIEAIDVDISPHAARQKMQRRTP